MVPVLAPMVRLLEFGGIPHTYVCPLDLPQTVAHSVLWGSHTCNNIYRSGRHIAALCKETPFMTSGVCVAIVLGHLS